MSKLKVASGAWVVVCDGRKALILENHGDEAYPDLRLRNVYEHEDAPTRALGVDAPTSVANSVGSARSTVAVTDWHDQAEQQFLTTLAGRLDAAVQGGMVTSLAVVAPPRALGMLRAAYSNGLRGAIAAELDKDLTNIPVDQIERQLVGIPGRG